jgi:biopolymer transport protein ExbD
MDEVSYTSPLHLRKYLRAVDTRLDPVPFINVMLLGLFFALCNSQFLLPPGIPINLPRGVQGGLVPEPVAAVVTVLPPLPGDETAEGMVLFGGDLIRQGALEEALAGFLKTHPSKNPVLLLKMDARASLSQLVKISEAARTSGFTSMQIAAEELTTESGVFEK